MNYNYSVVKINVQVLKQDVDMPWKTTNISSATGTGFFIDSKGHILTCYHVVRICPLLSIKNPVPVAEIILLVFQGISTSCFNTWTFIFTTE